MTMKSDAALEKTIKVSNETVLATLDDKETACALRSLLLTKHRSLQPWIYIFNRPAKSDVSLRVFDVAISTAHASKFAVAVLEPIIETVNDFLELLTKPNETADLP